jgi:cytochrome c
MKTQWMLLAASAAACLALNAAAQAPVPALAAPAESTIPAGPKGIAIQEGRKLLTETHQRLPNNVGNGLNCTSCHLAGGTTANASPWIGIWGGVSGISFAQRQSHFLAGAGQRLLPAFDEWQAAGVRLGRNE